MERIQATQTEHDEHPNLPELELSPQEKIHQLIQDRFRAPLEEHADDQNYANSPQHFLDTLSSASDICESSEDIDILDTEILPAVYGEFLQFAKQYCEQGGIMPPAIDSMIFNLDSFNQSEELTSILENNSEVLEYVRNKRIEQLPQQITQELHELQAELYEATRDDRQNDFLDSRDYIGEVIADKVKLLKEHQEELEKNGLIYDEALGYIGSQLLPFYLPKTSSSHDSQLFDTLIKTTKAEPKLLNYLDDNTRACVEFVNNPNDTISEDAHSVLNSFIGNYLYEGNDRPIVENGKPNANLGQALLFSETILSQALSPNKDNSGQISANGAYELIKAYAEPSIVRVIDDLRQIGQESNRIDAGSVALLSLETDSNLYQEKLKMVSRIMAQKLPNVTDGGMVPMYKYLLAAQNTEDTKKSAAELEQVFDQSLARWAMNGERSYGAAIIESRQHSDEYNAWRIVNYIAKDMPHTRIPNQRADSAMQGVRVLLWSNAELDEQVTRQACENIHLLADLCDLDPNNSIIDNLIRRATYGQPVIDLEYKKRIEVLTKNIKGLYEHLQKPEEYSDKKKVFDSILGLYAIAEGEIDDDSFEDIINLVQRVESSNSLDIRRISTELIDELIHTCSDGHGEEESYSIDTSAAYEKLQKIEDIFLRNNLPLAAKRFLIFATLHPKEMFEHDFLTDRLSPTLKVTKNNGPFGRYSIALRDLIKNSLESNDPDLRKYLENMRDGQSIINAIKSGQISFEELSESQQREAQSFIRHVATIYNPSRRSHESTIDPNLPITAENIQSIYQSLHLGPNDNISNFTVRYFGLRNGLRTAEDALEQMDKMREAADRRNTETAASQLVIKPGDLIKNVDGTYLDDALAYGTNCKEFLGKDAGSDLTKLDSDFSMYLGRTETTIESCKEIQNKPHGNYGYVWFILDNNPKDFITTRKGRNQPGGEVEQPNAADNRLELFQTGVQGEGHYGVRTGFGSERIKAMVIDQAEELYDRTCFKIVKNGFYIPLYDKNTGNLIFTKDQYLAMRERLSGNPEYHTGEYKRASTEDFANDTERISKLNLSQEIDVYANRAEAERKDGAIRAAIMQKLTGTGLTMRNRIENDLTPGIIEVISTGSTGRGTNVPGDGDFDYIFRIDREIYCDPERMKELAETIKSAIQLTPGVSTVRRGGVSPHDIRTEHVHVDGLNEEVDVDITFVQRTDKITYPTEQAVVDYMANLTGNEREQAIKNIIAAKKLFKLNECYKPRHEGGEDETTNKPKAQGGMGGIGTENWILQNGGSLTAAARSFLESAQALHGEKPIPFDDFKKKYQIWNLGANHTAEERNEYPHNNFIADNMDQSGYAKTVKALQEFLDIRTTE